MQPIQIATRRKPIKSSRLLTAALLLPVLFGLIWWLPSFFFFVLILIIILRVQYEFYLLYFKPPNLKSISVGLFFGIVLAATFYFKISATGFALLACLFVLLLYVLSTIKTMEKTLCDVAVLFIGVAYIAGFLSHLFLIRELPSGRGLIVLLLLMTWGSDAGAYYVGRNFGKTKLSPLVSPNKTVEGALGGMVTTFVGAFAAQATFLPSLRIMDVVILSLLIGTFGPIGDLVESMFKRAAGVKDSSSIIPSHGGLFDKVDSIAFAAPLLYYYLTFTQ